jgi:pimeloyl-ACP methyl ester carboxylesterase
MPAIVTDDGVTLHAEETGTGEPLLFIHEFAGDHRSWEPQVRFFSACRVTPSSVTIAGMAPSLGSFDGPYSVISFTGSAPIMC